MNRILITLSLAGLLTAFFPAAVQAAEMEAIAAEQVDDQIDISIEGQTVTVTGAQGKELIVVSLTGRQLMKVRIDSPAQCIELNIPKGCYILKVGKVVRKIQLC